MDVINLPTESAIEPNEEARQPRVNKQECNNLAFNFAETTELLTPINTAYKNSLSQPPMNISHKQKLIWLQQRRTEGLWAQCDSCNRWRYLPQVLDKHELPTKWYCWMNPDKSIASCTAPEVPICLYDEDDLIHAEYTAGSIVLARLPGFPWWPAMVCDCPDTEQYYWLDGFSDIPTHYNVVFFDAIDISRAWMTPEQLMPYKTNTKLLKKSLKTKNYKSRLEVAIIQANDAEKLPLSARLAKYSFVSRFNGNILTPTKVKKHVITKYRNMIKRKFNIIDLSDESQSSGEEVMGVEKIKIKKKKPQKNINKKKVKNNRSTEHDKINDGMIDNTADNLDSTKELNSLAVQIDSHSGLKESITSDASYKGPEKNTVSDSFVSESVDSQDITNTVLTFEDSQNSDNFDF